MSLLAPLYFLGALAVGLPILFHLIRRQPKGQVEFSSLMFLRPTPPRLTRRSRLDNWLLLLLRALALMLLAAAFARPFLRSVADLGSRVTRTHGSCCWSTPVPACSGPDCGSRRSIEASEVLAGSATSRLARAWSPSIPQPKLAVSFDESGRMNVEQIRSARATGVARSQADLASHRPGPSDQFCRRFRGHL